MQENPQMQPRTSQVSDIQGETTFLDVPYSKDILNILLIKCSVSMYSNAPSF